MNIDRLLNGKRLVVEFEPIHIHVDSAFVKQFREKNNLTKAALANLLGVTKTLVARWENGTSRVIGGNAVLLYSLNNNPSLLKQLYHVRFIGKGVNS